MFKKGGKFRTILAATIIAAVLSACPFSTSAANESSVATAVSYADSKETNTPETTVRRMKATLAVGQEWKLPGNLTDWKSSNPYVVSVQSDGTVRGMKEGRAVVSTERNGKRTEWRISSVRAGSFITSETTDPKRSPKESDVRRIVMSFEKKYPAGTPFGDDKAYFWNGGRFAGGTGCGAFAFEISDAAFGNRKSVKLRRNDASLFDCARPGDLLRLKGDEHVVIVVTKEKDALTVAEANYNGKVRWDRIIRKEEADAGEYLLSRY